MLVSLAIAYGALYEGAVIGTSEWVITSKFCFSTAGNRRHLFLKIVTVRVGTGNLTYDITTTKPGTMLCFFDDVEWAAMEANYADCLQRVRNLFFAPRC